MSRQFFLGTLVMLLVFSCTDPQERTDLTEEGVFTKGIEGPATDSEGNIYAVNYSKEGTIGRVTTDGKSSLFISLPGKSIGNGIRFANDSIMYVADYTNHNVLEINIKTKDIQVYAHQATANQPNDIAISPEGILYASDPDWKEGTGNVWKITKENGFELLEANMGTTNGIEVSPDGKKLYVNESVQRKVWVYDRMPSGNLKNKKEFYSFEDYGLDGMRCDPLGNLYICRYDKGTVAVLSPQGQLIKEYVLKGKKPTNITFSNDYKECFITMADRGCIEKVLNTLL
ncbi:SMP-30/gluconolactonase/LRE family protein [Aquimarina sp. TRL1]|uniref:SMP-30/gluconolactonase/LRE family protein n=1 Tax=Aquimarina sp. (strain TRL1) TaxID=2736252 RepID=UPI00158E4A6C|nr:SMP-30/gluconolactonase/LRE family protein [Aquimarina sp. TRL1]QKX07239.1 SMP-30/gluconolactonase/LRE family protein [Aquimarina sp. TRL1]